MAWRVATSLIKLRDQIDVAYPGRDKSSAGTIGEARHAASKSDHNPNTAGVVTAMDITHDRAHGMNSGTLAEYLRLSRDKRIKYVISNARIFSSLVEPWKWRAYNGANAHRAHVHISVMGEERLYDDPASWTAVVAMTGGQPSEPQSTDKWEVTSTEFGGHGDEQAVAYADVKPGWEDRPGVALPMRFIGKRPRVRVTRGKKSIDCEIVDVGPWYPSKRGPADPYWTTGARPRAETDKRTNKAAIDLTPAAARAVGLQGKGTVTWEFI